MALLWVKEQNRQALLQLENLERSQIKSANFWETLETDRYLMTTYLNVEKAAKSRGMIQSQQVAQPLLIHHGQVRTH
jgi:hypothetical protein